MLKKKMTPTELLDVATKIEIQLQEYDAIRATKSPDKVVIGVGTAQQALKDAVNSADYDRESLFTFFQSLLGELETIEKDYDEVKSKAEAARQAIAEL